VLGKEVILPAFLRKERLSGKHRQLPLVTMDVRRFEKGASPDLKGWFAEKYLNSSLMQVFLPVAESCLRSGLVQARDMPGGLIGAKCLKARGELEMKSRKVQ
jgi:hypothetical protein